MNRLAGIKTLLGFGPKISSSAEARPDGLLRHETVLYSMFPMHVGMRQYWRDQNSLLQWSRSEPHRLWWQSFLKDPVEPASGTKRIFDAGAWKRSTMIYRKNSASPRSRQWCRLADRCSARQPEPARSSHSNQSCPLPVSRLPGINPANFRQVRFWITSGLPTTHPDLRIHV